MRGGSLQRPESGLERSRKARKIRCSQGAARSHRNLGAIAKPRRKLAEAEKPRRDPENSSKRGCRRAKMKALGEAAKTKGPC